MKYLLSGAAIAAPLAIAGPPAMNGTDTQLGAAPSVSYPSSATPSRHRDARAQRLVPFSNTALHHAPRPSRRIADRLNHQELLGCRRVAPTSAAWTQMQGPRPSSERWIALESSEKSHSPMLTERIKA
jgi:hypothetical protein